MAEEIRAELDGLKDGNWFILSKNQLFWKARLDPSENSDGSILSISYGKSLSQLMTTKTSQAFEHETRENAMTALAKLVKEKAKNGYEIHMSMLQDKENKPADKKSGKKSPMKTSKLTKIEVDQIEHRCNHIPLILTEDFEERNLAKTAEKERNLDMEDSSLGKRNKSGNKKTHQNKRDSEMKDLGAVLPQAMTIDEMLDKPSGKKRTQEAEPQNKVPENTPRKEASPLKQVSGQKSVKSKASNQSETKEAPKSLQKTPSNKKSIKSASKNQEEKMEEEELKPNVEVNLLMECKITGNELYHTTHNSRQFTRQILIQVSNEYIYFEYSVAEDLTMSSKLLLKFSSNSQAVEASNIQTFHLEERGFKSSSSLPPNMITPGTITTIVNRESCFVDCSAKDPSDVLSMTSDMLSLKIVDTNDRHVNDSVVDDDVKMISDRMIEEKVVEKQIVGDNVDYELMSHSEVTISFEKVGRNKGVEVVCEDRDARKQEMERFVEEASKGNGVNGNKFVQPLGPNSDSMIGLILLNQYKSTIEISSKNNLIETGSCQKNWMASGASGLERI